MIAITTSDDPRIRHYMSLRSTPALHSQEKVFVAEGEKIVRALLMSTLPVLSLFALPDYFPQLMPLIAQKGIREEQLFTADSALMDAIVGFRLHQGIMAIGKQPDETPLNRLASPIVVLDDIVNSENVGAIVRNCAAFGVRSLIIGPGGSSPYLRRAVRTSMGAIFTMQIHYTDDLAWTLKELREGYGYAVIGAETLEAAVPLPQYSFPERFALLIGSEGHGLSASAIAHCTSLVHIPMSNDSSLNAAAATAILLYAIRQQSL